MLTSETLSKIAPALALAQTEFRAIGKSGHNHYDNYDYSTLEDYMESIRPILNQHGLTLLASVTETIALEDRPTAAGKIEHAVRVKLSMRVLHESGEWIEAESWGEGQDRADKAVYKAITGARKYGIAAVFGLVTTDDPEATLRADGKPNGKVVPRANGNRQPVKPANGHPVQPAKGPYPPATAAQEIVAESGEAFAMRLSIAFRERQFSNEEMVRAVNEHCRQQVVSDIYELSEQDRAKLLDKVSRGQFDRFRAPKAPRIPQVA